MMVGNMNFNSFAFFFLAISTITILPSSNNNFQNTARFAVSDTRRLSQPQSRMASPAAMAKKNKKIDTNVTPLEYQVTPEKLVALEKQLKIASENEKKRRKKFYCFEERIVPFFEDVYDKERTRGGSPDIRLQCHAQSGLSAGRKYDGQLRYWRDRTSRPTSPSTFSKTKKDDVLSVEPMEIDMVPRRTFVTIEELEIPLLQEEARQKYRSALLSEEESK